MASTAPTPGPGTSSCNLSSHEARDVEAQLDHLQAQLGEMHDTRIHTQQLVTLGRISSAIAHEYHNILTPVISYAQFALEHPADIDLLRQGLRRALAGAQRATRISHTLLGLARDTPPPTNSRGINLSDMINDSVATLGYDLAADNIQLQIDVPAVRPDIDPLCLQQVLVNLLLNARSAILSSNNDTASEKRISLCGRIEAQRLHLSVTDTGPGIPEEMLSKLFEPFVTQVENRRSAEAPAAGNGLGLSICRDLLASIGGDIQARNLTDGGAAFDLTIPAGATSHDPQQA